MADHESNLQSFLESLKNRLRIRQNHLAAKEQLVRQGIENSFILRKFLKDLQVVGSFAKGTAVVASDIDMVLQLDIPLTEFLSSFDVIKNEIFALLKISILADSLAVGKHSVICKWDDKYSCDICISPAEPPEDLWNLLEHRSDTDKNRCGPAFSRMQRDFISARFVKNDFCRDAILLAKWWSYDRLPSHTISSNLIELLMIYVMETEKESVLSLTDLLRLFFNLLEKLPGQKIIFNEELYHRFPSSDTQSMCFVQNPANPFNNLGIYLTKENHQEILPVIQAGFEYLCNAARKEEKKSL